MVKRVVKISGQAVVKVKAVISGQSSDQSQRPISGQSLIAGGQKVIRQHRLNKGQTASIDRSGAWWAFYGGQLVVKYLMVAK